MIDHVSIQCAEVPASLAFYDAVLAPLGGARVLDFGQVVGFGIAEPCIWPEYNAGYYGALVRDPDGNNIEAVCHTAGS